AVNRVTTVAVKKYCARMLSPFRSCLLQPNSSRRGLSSSCEAPATPRTLRRAEPLVSHNTAGVMEGGAPRDSVLGELRFGVKPHSTILLVFRVDHRPPGLNTPSAVAAVRATTS